MNEKKEITTGYRNARKILIIMIGLIIAWASAQISIKSGSTGSFLNFEIDKNAFIPFVLVVLNCYAMIKCTIEYMMQEDIIRKWTLAQTDYQIAFFLFEFSLIAISSALIARTKEMLFYVVIIYVSAFLIIMFMTFVLMMLIVPIRLYIRNKKGRLSVANASSEAMAYAFFISICLSILFIVLIGANVISPFIYFDFIPKSIYWWQLLSFAIIGLALLFSFLYNGKFLDMVFLYESETIMKECVAKDGIRHVSFIKNPKYPDYEKHQSEVDTLYLNKGEFVKLYSELDMVEYINKTQRKA